jgi:hypothetical protein
MSLATSESCQKATWIQEQDRCGRTDRRPHPITVVYDKIYPAPVAGWDQVTAVTGGLAGECAHATVERTVNRRLRGTKAFRNMVRVTQRGFAG